MIYEKAGQRFECELLTGSRKVITFNRMRVGRIGQWFVKPEGIKAQITPPSEHHGVKDLGGIPIINGAYFEDDNLFQKHFKKV